MDKNLKELLGQPIEECTSGITPGSICYCPVPRISNSFSVVRPIKYDPATPESSQYCMKKVPLQDLCNNLPHKELGIESTEDCLVTIVKKRPVVILTHPLTRSDSKGFPPHYINSVLCAPLYTIVESDNSIRTSYNPKIVHNITALKYPHIFPVPSSPIKSKVSALRLDRIQPFHIDSLSLTGLKLTRRWIAYIRDWIHFYGNGSLQPSTPKTIKRIETLKAARELMIEAVEKLYST